MTRWWACLLLTACTTRHDSSVYGRPWTFTVESASIDTTQANGDAWDPDLSPPDGFVRLYIDGQQFATSPTIDDSYNPRWDYQPASMVIDQGETLSIDLIDSDTFDDDPVFYDCSIPLLPDVADGGADCSSASGTVRIGVYVD